MFVAVTTPATTNMSLHFSLTDGTPLTSIAGLPKNYTGAILNGAHTSHVLHSHGSIVIQEFTTRQCTIRKMQVTWQKPIRIKCEHNYLAPVIFCRATDNKSICEVIKGAGDMYQQKQQFSVVSGSKWSGLLISEKPGDHYFTDFTWNADFVSTLLSDDPYYNKLSQQIQFDLPERLTPAARDLSDQMHNVIAKLLALNYSEGESVPVYDELMSRLIKLIFYEMKECESVKKKMKEADWHNINKAKKLIDYNLNTQFTTPELSIKVGVNEYKLKKLFPKVAGYSVEEYRRYKLLCKAAKNIVQQPDASIKMFSEEAGYDTVSTFTRAFKKMGCTPGELREDTWDLQKLERIISPEGRMTDNFKYGTLIVKLMREKISKEEAQDLDAWILQSDSNMKLFEMLMNDYKADWAKSWFKAAGVNYKGVKWKNVTGWYKPEHKNVWDFYIVIAAVVAFLMIVYLVLMF